MQCPNCKTNIQIASIIPDESQMTFQIIFEGEMLNARTAAETILNMEKLLRAVAKEMDARCAVYLKAIRYEPPTFAVDIAVVRQSLKPPRSAMEDR